MGRLVRDDRKATETQILKCKFMHLADAFIQSDLQYIQAIIFLSVYTISNKPLFTTKACRIPSLMHN